MTNETLRLAREALAEYYKDDAPVMVLIDSELAQAEQAKGQKTWLMQKAEAAGFVTLEGYVHWLEQKSAIIPPAQPAREWADLTESEIQDALEAEFLGSLSKRNWQDDLRVARAMESASREKNAGQPVKTPKIVPMEHTHIIR